MDPNATLKAFHQAQEAALLALENEDTEAELEALQEAVEAADSLFQWLSRGGYSPEGWAR